MKYKAGDRAQWSIGGNWWTPVTIIEVKPTNSDFIGFDYEVMADDGGITGGHEGARESELKDFADAND